MDSSQSDSEKTFASPNRRPAKKKKRKPEEETGVVSEDEIAVSQGAHKGVISTVKS